METARVTPAWHGPLTCRRYAADTAAVTASTARTTERGDTGPGCSSALALATDTADEIVLGTVRDVHGAVAGRVHGVTGRATGGSSRPVEAVHERVVLGGLRRARRRPARRQPWPAPADRCGVGRPIERPPAGRLVMSAVNGLIGDRLRRASGSSSRSRWRCGDDGRDVPLEPDALARGVPDRDRRPGGLPARPRRGRRGVAPGSAGERQAATASGWPPTTAWTPVYLRANTGLPIAENGVALAALLDAAGDGLAHRRTPDRAGRALDGRPRRPGGLRGRAPTRPTPGPTW